MNQALIRDQIEPNDIVTRQLVITPAIDWSTASFSYGFINLGSTLVKPPIEHTILQSSDRMPDGP